MSSFAMALEYTVYGFLFAILSYMVAILVRIWRSSPLNRIQRVMWTLLIVGLPVIILIAVAGQEKEIHQSAASLLFITLITYPLMIDKHKPLRIFGLILLAFFILAFLVLSNLPVRE